MGPRYAPDQSANYNTSLTPAQEAAFQQWARQSGRERDVYDYDLRGAWLKSAKAAGNGHLPDTYKKPNHPTFSRESDYSNALAQGGDWVSGADGNWLFFASPDNLRYRTPEALRNYFADVERGNRLVEPQNALAIPRVR